jgi:hypothetical protein
VLQTVIQRLDYLRSQVDLLQRYRLPFALKEGTAVPGLTGSGSFAVTRAIGFRVFLTTPPPGGATMPGNPPYVRDAGWISVTDGGAMLQERRVSQSGFEWYPQECQLATSFNWALDDGVVMRVEAIYAES